MKRIYFDPQQQKLPFSQKILVVFSYIFFLPVFKIIFTDLRKNKFLAFHASQSFFSWIFFFSLVVLIKFIAYYLSFYVKISFLEELLNIIFLAFELFMLWCSILFLAGKMLLIPFITSISKRLA